MRTSQIFNLKSQNVCLIWLSISLFNKIFTLMLELEIFEFIVTVNNPIGKADI
jgi:hypothetical protein